MHRRAVVAAFCSLLTGCTGVSARGVWEDAPPEETERTDAPTATPTGTPAPTATKTSTATPFFFNDTATTETPTETPTPTATPEPEDIVVGMSKWAEMETDGTTLDIRVTHYDTAEKIPRQNGGPISPSNEDETLLIANIELRNLRTRTTVGWPQWSMIDFQGTEHDPYQKAMNQGKDVLAKETHIGIVDEFIATRVVFSVRYPTVDEWVVEPYDGHDGPTVRIVSD